MHEKPHPNAGNIMTIEAKGLKGVFDSEDFHCREFILEDWWDRVYGRSWKLADGNPAALTYALRAGFFGLPPDDEVVYGKVDNAGVLIHQSEIIQRSP